MKTTDIKRQLRIRIATPEDAARLVAIYAPCGKYLYYL